MGELMTIGAFARRTGLSVSALRFYAGRQLLLPAEVDSTSGYRRYTEDQVSDGVLVCNLRRLDMPLSEIALALGRSERERKELVERHLEHLEQVVGRAHALAHALGLVTTKETPMLATLPTLDLALALDQVLPAAGADPELPHLMSVLIEGKEGSVRLVATDRYRLAIRDLVPTTLEREFSWVVPAASLARWRPSLTDAGEVAMTLDVGHLRVAGADIDLSAPLVPTTFPDYERFLESTGGVTSVQVDRRQLLAATGRFERDDTIVVTAGEGLLRIDGDGQSVDLTARCDGPEPRVALNAGFVADAARHAVGAEIVFEVEDALKPVLFRSADDGTFTSLVMPIKE